MTSETPIISSISGGNINLLNVAKKSNSDTSHEQKKRNFVFGNDKIENLQLHENVANSPSSTTWNKVSFKRKLLIFTLKKFLYYFSICSAVKFTSYQLAFLWTLYKVFRDIYCFS